MPDRSGITPMKGIRSIAIGPQTSLFMASRVCSPWTVLVKRAMTT